MDAHSVDRLSRLVAHASTRRTLLGVGAAIGLAATPGDARKRKKKKKCKGGTKKCGKRCIPSTACCTSAECAPGGTCQDGTCTTPSTTTTPAPFCAGKPDNGTTFCGEQPFDANDKSTWYFCQGGACGLWPDCDDRGRRCSGDTTRCCSSPTTSCDTLGICGCSSVGLPCTGHYDCCGSDAGAVCIGFVCHLP